MRGASEGTSWRWFWCAVAAALALPLGFAFAEEEEQDQLLRLGRRIYSEGRGTAGNDIVVRIGGDDGVDVPGWTMPCVNCHGQHGRGGLPGQEVSPPDIRWRTLRRPYVTPDGRTRPAYRERTSIRRAISKGLDAGDQPLSMAMPRYRLSDEQWRALVAYLESM